jgi:hypothetical protein
VEDRYENYPASGLSTAALLLNGRGYSARVRQTTPITLDLPGVPRQGPVPITVTSQMNGPNDGQNLIGNPYASPINWDNVTLPPGVNPQIILKDNSGIHVPAGNFIYYTQGAPGAGIPASYTGTIASGQAFQVRTSVSSATITFQEDDKQAIFNQPFIRQGTLHDILRITVNGNDNQDEMVVRFDDLAQDGFDELDAMKMRNDFINLSSITKDSLAVAINVYNSLSCNKEVSLVLNDVTPGNYNFAFSQFDSFSDDIQLKLLDSFTGTTMDIKDGNDTYQFAVTDDVRTFGKNRFKVYFSYPTIETALSLTSSDVCSGNNATVTVQNSQKGVTYFSTINGKVVSEEVDSNGGDVELNIASGDLSPENTVVVMASIAGCSPVPLDRSIVLRTGNAFPVNIESAGKTCGSGKATIVVSGAPAGGSYKWYETATASESIAGQTSAEFVTPDLTKSKTYFVSTVNAQGCESARKQVAADVVYLDPVTISVEEQFLVSSYPAGNQWYLDGQKIPGATDARVEVTETGVYEVQVSANGCTTAAAREMIVLGAENANNSGYEFYPNPVENVLQVELPENSEASGLVQNALGQSVGKIGFKLTDGKLKGEYNFGGHTAGVYFIKVFQGNKIVNKKVIKK